MTPGCAEVDDSPRTLAAGGSRAAAQTVGVIRAADAAFRAPCCLAIEPLVLLRIRLAHVAVPGLLVAMTSGCAEVDGSPRTLAAGGSRAAAQTVGVVRAADAAFRAPCCLAIEPLVLLLLRICLAHVAIPSLLVALTPGCAEVDDSPWTLAAGSSRAAAQTVGFIRAADAAFRAPCCLAIEPQASLRVPLLRLVLAHVAVPILLVAMTPGCAEVDDSPWTLAAGGSRAAAQTVGVIRAADAAFRAPCCLAKETPQASLQACS